MKDLPPELDPIKVSEKTNSSTTAFFGQLHPFSSFHDATFKVNGTMYSCTEQYIQSEKTMMFGDDVANHKIMKSKIHMTLGAQVVKSGTIYHRSGSLRLQELRLWLH
jgi:predicted NAD-dependent protein-ADP-ribosyltransferase YbiA (DUF1768 family)